MSEPISADIRARLMRQGYTIRETRYQGSHEILATDGHRHHFAAAPSWAEAYRAMERSVSTRRPGRQ